MSDVIIIGGGPAGVSAALYTIRAGLDTIIVENGAGALAKAHRIENYYGAAAEGAELYELGLQQARSLGVKVIHDEVVGIDYYGEYAIKLATEGKLLQAPVLLIATGAQQPAPEISGLKELEGRGISYCAVCDGFFFRGKRVAVLGNGAYAAHEAEYLSHLAAETIVLTNGNSSDLIRGTGLKTNEAIIASINGEGRLQSISFEDGSELELDGLFIALGTAGAGDIAKKLGLETEGRFLKVNQEGATALPGLYAAGDCTGGLMQVAKAVADGANAGMAMVKFIRAMKK